MNIPNKAPLVGGAMDLAAAARSVWLLMEHTTRAGEPWIVERCSLPLTAKGCVKRIFTDLATMEVGPSGIVVREIVEGLSQTELQALTGATLSFAADSRPLVAPPLAATPE